MKECLRNFDKAKSQLKTAQSSLVKAQSENNDLKKKAAQAKQSFEVFCYFVWLAVRHIFTS
jgi:cellobiose-specific phosphotransferase system component IIA